MLKLASRSLAVTLSAVVLAACSPKAPSPDSTQANVATSTAAPGDSAKPADTGMAGMPGMANMTGDPDHDFLRMMTDHHKGLILMAHQTKESSQQLSTKPLATRLDKEQDEELDKMMSMLEKDYKDAYAPKVMPAHAKMAEDLQGKTGGDYDRTFMQDVITHHQEAIKMIDDYLPRAKNPTLKAMAEEMKATQTQEITELQKKVAS
jgi:uncharacterized protein (DUF305 family)